MSVLGRWCSTVNDSDPLQAIGWARLRTILWSCAGCKDITMIQHTAKPGCLFVHSNSQTVRSMQLLGVEHILNRVQPTLSMLISSFWNCACRWWQRQAPNPYNRFIPILHGYPSEQKENSGRAQENWHHKSAEFAQCRCVCWLNLYHLRMCLVRSRKWHMSIWHPEA